MTFPDSPSQMSFAQFRQTFGEIYEKSEWVAAVAFNTPLTREHDTVTGLHKLMAGIVDQSDKAARLELLQAHPELAGRAAIAGELTDASASEQTDAGLDHCTPAELRQFNKFNTQYTEQFGFPFIMAVKGATRFQILTAFEKRIHNDYQTEFDTAIQQVHQIARFRLLAMCTTTT